MHPHSPPLSCFFCSLSWLGKSRQWQTGVWPVERKWRDAGRDAGRDAASSLYKSQSHLVKPIIQQTRIYLGEIGVAVVICLSSGPGFGNHWLCCCYGLNWGFPDSSVVKKKNLPAVQDTRVPSLGREDPLEEEVATHPSILPWRIPLDRGAWWATAQTLTKSQTQLKWLSMHAHTHKLNVSPSNFIRSSPNPQCLRMWPYLETGSL